MKNHNQKQKPAPKESLSVVLWNKIVFFVRDHSLKTIGEYLLLSYIALMYSVAMIDGRAAYLFARWHGDVPAKLVVPFVVIFNWRRIARLLGAWLAPIFEAEQVNDEGESIEGVPTAEVIDWLFTRGGWKREEVKKKLGMPHHRCQALAEHMERVEILVKDKMKGNARVLNPEFSRQDVASILAGKSMAEELEPLWRKSDRGFTSAPSAKEIENRVTPLSPDHSPTPGFTSRVLAS